MEGLCRSYSSPAASIRRTLRRETRSISEWREKGKYQPFDLVKAAQCQTQTFPQRAATWDGAKTRPAWPPTVSIEIEFNHYDDDDESLSGEDEYYDAYEQDSYVYGSLPPVQETAASDYFLTLPRAPIVDEYDEYEQEEMTDGAEDLFAEEPLAADVPEAELEESRRRSIEVERQPLFLETKEDEVPVEDIIQHLGDSSLDPQSPAPSKEAPAIATTIVVEELGTAEPPSPEEIIEHSPPPSRGSNDAPKPDFPTITARDRFLKAKKVLFTVDVLKKCIPPAPPPDELIEEPRSRKAKAVTPPRAVTPPPKTTATPPPKEATPAAKIALEAFKPAKPSFAKLIAAAAAKQAEAPTAEEPAPVAEEANAAPTIEVTPVLEAVQSEPAAPTETGDSLAPAPAPAPTPTPTPPPTTVSQHLYPPRPDEGYLSGESDNESDDGNGGFGVSLDEQITMHDEASSDEGEAPLPEDIITTTTSPRPSERYQHHCLVHGHFFPKAGPLRSPGFPYEPFFPVIQCDRCQQPRLAEAWQCSLLNQCGAIVCTPCHDELVYGVVPKKEEKVSVVMVDPLAARVDGVRQGLELGLQRGMTIGFEVGLGSKPKGMMDRQARRGSETHDSNSVGFKSSRSWETHPKDARRKMSMEF